MNERRIFALLLLLPLAALLAGCDKSAEPAVAPPSVLGEPTEAQPPLQTVKLWVGAEELKAELAVTPVQQRAGMMFRTQMAENEAMLFVFGGPHRASFWMKNTVLPLSAAYISPEGEILEIHDLQPHDTNSVVAASDRIQFVLETKQGWFHRHNITTGMILRTERGSLLETFFGQQR